MSNKERLEFIEKNHPKLYALLCMCVPMSVENTDCMTRHDIYECNKKVSLYCQNANITDPELCSTLIFRVD